MTRISDILKKKGSQVFQISPDATVYEAIAAMVEHGVGSLLVTHDGAIEGIVTERDYLAKVALQGRASRTTKVREIMSANPICVDPEQDVAEAMAVMSEARIRHLPLMKDGKLAGMISIGDCVKQISHDRKAHIRTLTEYISDRYPG
ncbi:MAG TPA: CBS domain-containing protein [Candidatus Krumholzibacteria bacterium]|nr:CBS domain-containing protein [Candidatus Krumholzibacteria bacterium]HRX51348.1 CBS domain-containing protein [Candidatus Krumholzibacteria bacterium]